MDKIAEPFAGTSSVRKGLNFLVRVMPAGALDIGYYDCLLGETLVLFVV
jgi:hypothetical protein